MLHDTSMGAFVRNNISLIGDNAHPTLLYAHGFGCSQDMWHAITPAFEDSHRQILFDYTGSGRSVRGAFSPERYSTLDGYASDILDVCAAVGVRSGVTLIAHSVSCMIGVLAALRQPGLFSGMVMIGPSPCYLNHPPEYRGGFEQSDLEDLLKMMDQNYIGWAGMLAGIAAGEGQSTTAGKLESSFCSTDPVAARSFAQATFFSDHRADLERLDCPTLILQHRDDVLAPVHVGEFVRGRIAGSRMEMLDVSGHCAHLSHPDLVIAAMRSSGLDAFRRDAAPDDTH